MTEMVLASAQTPTLWKPKGRTTAKTAGKIVTAFLDTATTSFGRATHYNTRDEQQAAELKCHEGLFNLERDLYLAFMALPGVTDRARQIGLKKLLGTGRTSDAFLTGEDERAVLYHLIQNLPPQRMLKLLDALRMGNDKLGIPKANNARTRKLILRTLLSSRRLQLWAVKYRTKVRRALTHAWGQRTTSIIGKILRKEPEARDSKENSILQKQIIRFALTGRAMDAVRAERAAGKSVAEFVGQDREKALVALQSVGFVLDIRDRLTLPLFKAFVEAKDDLSKGKRLPPEVLEGIRSTYHKDVPKEEIIKLTARTMTKGQKLAVQKRAKKAGVRVDVDLTAQEAVKLYIYAFENGMTDEIAEALEKKGADAAKRFPVSFNRVGILVDASRSMEGSTTQKLRPMAATLAMKDMLSCTAPVADITYAGGEDKNGLLHPAGDTQLAEALLALIADAPDAIFVLSDGYENSPSGRCAEVLEQVKDLGLEVPVYHLNPVFAAEASGVRELAKGLATTLPVQGPASLGTTFIRGMIEQDPIRGINALLRAALTTGPVERKLLAS